MKFAASELNREAAKECSPRRKPWVTVGKCTSPEGAKEKFSRLGSAE